jgi:hypothetical protein
MKGELKMTDTVKYGGKEYEITGELNELEALIVKYAEDSESIYEFVNLLAAVFDDDCQKKTLELLEVKNEWNHLANVRDALKKEANAEDGLIELAEKKMISNLTRIYELIGELKEAYLTTEATGIPQKVLEEKFKF